MVAGEEDFLDDLWLALRCMGQKGVTTGTPKQLKDRLLLLHWACDYLMGYVQDLGNYTSYMDSILDDAEIGHDEFMALFGHKLDNPHDPKNKIQGFQTVYITPDTMEDILNEILNFGTAAAEDEDLLDNDEDEEGTGDDDEHYYYD